MRSLFYLLAVISSGFFFTSIGPASAQTVSHDRKVGGFENVIISASENTYVHIAYDRSHKITVKADGRYLQKIKTTVTGDTLNVYIDPAELGSAKIDIYIRLPKVKRVVIAGSGQVNVVDPLLPVDLQASHNDFPGVS